MALIGVEAQDLLAGDEIVGIGIVKRSFIDSDGDVVVRLEMDPARYYQQAAYDKDAWLRVEREG